MDIDIRVTIDTTDHLNLTSHPTQQTHVAEETVVHLIVAEIPFVKSAVVIRPRTSAWIEGMFSPDESTRQER